jgi:hypothetical protein
MCGGLLELDYALHRSYRLRVFCRYILRRSDSACIVAGRAALAGRPHTDGGPGLEAAALSMTSLNIDFVAATMRVFLERCGERLIYNDPSNGEVLSIEPGPAAALDGLLPSILLAGESIWRELTGKGFELELTRDAEALLGHRLRAIGGPNFSIVMLCSIEALQQVTRSEGIVVNGFNALSASAAQRGRDRGKSVEGAVA